LLMADRMRWCGQQLARAMRGSFHALAYFGSAMSGLGGAIVPYPPYDPPERTATDYSGLDVDWAAQRRAVAPRALNPVPDREPPPGHPERLAFDLPPSPTERRLWSQFD
jgi:Family of unknown function (DUF6059)